MRGHFKSVLKGAINQEEDAEEKATYLLPSHENIAETDDQKLLLFFPDKIGGANQSQFEFFCPPRILNFVP